MTRTLCRSTLAAALLCALPLALPSPGVAETAAGPQEGREITFERPDGAVLKATLHLVRGEGRAPAVLLLHQAQRSRAEFEFLARDLHEMGFHTLAVDLRGHGDSTRPEILDRAFFMKLFRDPDFAPPDIEAILGWLSEHPRVDPERLAAVGGSVGANLSYIATGAGWGAKTAVVLSGNAEAVADLAAKTEDFAPRGVLLLAADGDSGRDAYARQLFEQAGEPKRLEIVTGSEAHGSELLLENPRLHKMTLEWLSRELGPR
ncbi:MAG: alpha/beta fold hydrolase [Acidobacteriota bacterium]